MALSISERLSEPSGTGNFEASEGMTASALRSREPPSSPSQPAAPRATLAEAKFTFLHGAWGCVQSLGSAEPRIVVKDGPS